MKGWIIVKMIQPFAFVNSWTAKKESEQAGESFGLTLIPLVIGLALLSFDLRSIAGWVLAGGGAVIIFVGILANLQIFFTPISLFNVIRDS